MLGNLFRVEFSRLSLLDDVVNDFFFKFDGVPTAGDYADIVTALTAFYNADNNGATSALATWMSYDVSRVADAHRIKVYEVPDAPGLLGPPVYQDTWTLDAGTVGAKNLPDEVAIALSFNADLTGVFEEVGTTRPRSRRRGRVFIGPLLDRTSDAAANATTPPRIADFFAQGLVNSAKEELRTTLLPTDWRWGVWSRAGWEAHEVVLEHVDNAYDTIRGRGTDADDRFFAP